MKLAKKLFILGVTAVMGFTFATGAFANDTKTQDIDVTIQGGGFSLNVPNLNPFNDITLTQERESYNTGFDGVFTIQDLSGTQAGWKLSVAATSLTEVDSDYELPAGSLTINPVDSITQTNYSNNDQPYVNLSSPHHLDDGDVTVATAAPGTGMGSFDLSFQDDNALGLHIDALTAREGTYESIITWNLVTGP